MDFLYQNSIVSASYGLEYYALWFSACEIAIKL